jgi:hypothetical protein
MLYIRSVILWSVYGCDDVYHYNVSDIAGCFLPVLTSNQLSERRLCSILNLKNGAKAPKKATYFAVELRKKGPLAQVASQCRMS